MLGHFRDNITLHEKQKLSLFNFKLLVASKLNFRFSLTGTIPILCYLLHFIFNLLFCSIFDSFTAHEAIFVTCFISAHHVFVYWSKLFTCCNYAFKLIKKYKIGGEFFLLLLDGAKGGFRICDIFILSLYHTLLGY